MEDATAMKGAAINLNPKVGLGVVSFASGCHAEGDIRAIFESSSALSETESDEKSWRLIFVLCQKSHFQYRAIWPAHLEKSVHSPGVRCVFRLYEERRLKHL